MRKQIEEGDTKGGLIFPMDKLRSLWIFKTGEWKEKQGECGSSKGRYIRTMFGYAGVR